LALLGLTLWFEVTSNFTFHIFVLFRRMHRLCTIPHVVNWAAEYFSLNILLVDVQVRFHFGVGRVGILGWALFRAVWSRLHE
jgi:hypothetical protein